MTTSPPAQPKTHLLWLLIAALFSLVVALVTGMIKVFGGAGPADAVLTGGTAYGGCLALCLAILAAARDK